MTWCASAALAIYIGWLKWMNLWKCVEEHVGMHPCQISHALLEDNLHRLHGYAGIRLYVPLQSLHVGHAWAGCSRTRWHEAWNHLILDISHPWRHDTKDGRLRETTRICAHLHPWSLHACATGRGSL
jgi:hypothetical protein